MRLRDLSRFGSTQKKLLNQSADRKKLRRAQYGRCVIPIQMSCASPRYSTTTLASYLLIHLAVSTKKSGVS